MTLAAGGPRPLQSERVRRDLETFWGVYGDVVDAVQDEIRDELREDPVLGSFIESSDDDDDQTQVLMVNAFEGGDWEPLVDHLRQQGVAYARQGMSFEGWFRVVSVFRPKLVPRLVDAYRDQPGELQAAVRGMGTFLDLMLETIGQAYLSTREDTIEKQHLAITELSTPVLQIRAGLLLLPIVGILDTGRSRQLTAQLLRAIQDKDARVVVMDITGVAEVDTEVANRLVQTAEAAKLMGATPILTGVSAGVAQTLVALGVDLKGLRTVGDLQGGIEAATSLLTADHGNGAVMGEDE